MKCAVTGAGGMIGGHLVRALLDEGHEVVAADIKAPSEWWQTHREATNLWGYDLSQPDSAAAVVSGCDEVYDLACPMGGIGWISTELFSCFASIGIQLSTVQACVGQYVGRYFFASSACAYNVDLQPSGADVALVESDAWPARPEPGYGEQKLMGERLAEYAPIEARVARYHNVAGAPGSWTGGKEKAPAAICRKVAEAKLSGVHEIEVWGDGTQRRSYLDVSDAVAGTLAVMRSDHPGPLNVGSDRAVCVDELVSIVEDIAGVTLDRTYDLSAPQGVGSRNADLSLVREAAGWEPKVSLEDCLARLYGYVEAEVAATR